MATDRRRVATHGVAVLQVEITESGQSNRLHCTILWLRALCFGVERPRCTRGSTCKGRPSSRTYVPVATCTELWGQPGASPLFHRYKTLPPCFPLPSACAAGTAMCARFRVCEIPEEGKVALLTTLRRLGLALALRNKRHFWSYLFPTGVFCLLQTHAHP